MATIAEMENKMTLFYMKSSGNIKMVTTGIQNMGIYGTEKEDYEQIIDFIVVDKNEFVMNNSSMYIVQDNKLKLNVEIPM